MAGYQSIYAGKSANPALGGKSNPFANDFKPGQYYVKNQPQPAAKQQTQQQQKPQQQSVTQKAGSLFDKVKSTAKNAAKSAIDDAKTAGEVGINTGAALGKAVTGNLEGAKYSLDKGVGGKGGIISSKQALSGGDGAKGYKDNFVKPVLKGAAQFAPYFVPVVKGGSLLSKVVKTGGINAVQSGITDVASQVADKGKVDLKQSGKAAAYGGAIGAVLPALDKGVGKLAGVSNKAAAKDLITNTKTSQLLQAGKDKTPSLGSRSIAGEKPIIVVPDRPQPKTAPILDPTTGKALNTVMAGVHQSKDDIAAQTSTQAASKAAEASTAQAAKATEKATADTKKIDQQLEVYDAKAKDAKAKGTSLSNVDQVKVKQLNEQKAALAPTVAPVPDKVPTIKAFGKDIQLTRENGYMPIETPSGTIYQKAQRKGTNAQGSSLHNAWYDANGTKITDEHAQMLKSSKPTPTVAPETPAKPIPQSQPAEVTPPPASPTVGKPAESVAPPKVSTAKPATTLTAVQTAHMPDIGGYNHSSHMETEYADMLRGMEQQVKGGQMIPDGEGGYKRISEHSPFYRDFYAENKKAPTKADYLEEAKRQLMSGKAVHGGSEDYKALLEREAKPIPQMKINAKPMASTGVTKTSKLALGVQENAVKEKLAKSLGDLPQYSKINMKEQAKLATDLASNDEARAIRIATGQEPPPAHILPESMFTVMELKAQATGDVNLLKQLANSSLVSEATAMGQRIRALGERDTNSPVAAIRQVKDIRTAALEKKTGKTEAKLQSDEIKLIRQAKPKVTKETFASFVESLKCP